MKKLILSVTTLALLSSPFASADEYTSVRISIQLPQSSFQKPQGTGVNYEKIGTTAALGGASVALLRKAAKSTLAEIKIDESAERIFVAKTHGDSLSVKSPLAAIREISEKMQPGDEVKVSFRGGSTNDVTTRTINHSEAGLTFAATENLIKQTEKEGGNIFMITHLPKASVQARSSKAFKSGAGVIAASIAGAATINEAISGEVANKLRKAQGKPQMDEFYRSAKAAE